MEEKSELERLQKYLDLESIEDAEKAKAILDILNQCGDWGQKVASYFTSILSGNPGTRTIIPENQVKAFKTVLLSHE